MVGSSPVSHCVSVSGFRSEATGKVNCNQIYANSLWIIVNVPTRDKYIIGSELFVFYEFLYHCISSDGMLENVFTQITE